MKINEVLNKVTLKLPGGGKFPLSKYAPYITNVDEDVEGLTGGNNILYAENIIYPEIFIVENYFESEKDMWEFRYRVEIGESDILNTTMNERYHHEMFKIFTKEEVIEYYNSLEKVFGSVDMYTNNNGLSINRFLQDILDNGWTITKEKLSDNNYLCYSYGTYYKEIDPYIASAEYFKELTLEDLSEDGQEFLDWFNENIFSKGYIIYIWKDESQSNELPQIPQEYRDEFDEEI